MTLQSTFLCLLLASHAAFATPSHEDPSTQPTPQIFAPGIISGPANDGSPTFSPGGQTLFFTRSAAHWSVILESHLVKGQWTKPTLASFSGEWPDSSPAMSPDGKFIVFQSTRPAVPLTVKPAPGQPIPGIVSNLWRVDRTPSGWSQPTRLPDAVNLGPSIWKPSVAANGNLYFTVIDNKTGHKSLYSSTLQNGVYQPGTALPFSDGTTGDVDPEIAPDESYLVFCSSARLKEDPTRDHLFLVAKQGATWGPVTPIRYAGDARYGFSTDQEPHIGQGNIYFNSDRAEVTHFPRTHAQAATDLDRLNAWDNSNSNVWYLPLAPYLDAAKTKS